MKAAPCSPGKEQPSLTSALLFCLIDLNSIRKDNDKLWGGARTPGTERTTLCRGLLCPANDSDRLWDAQAPLCAQCSTLGSPKLRNRRLKVYHKQAKRIWWPAAETCSAGNVPPVSPSPVPTGRCCHPLHLGNSSKDTDGKASPL